MWVKRCSGSNPPFPNYRIIKKNKNLFIKHVGESFVHVTAADAFI